MSTLEIVLGAVDTVVVPLTVYFGWRLSKKKKELQRIEEDAKEIRKCADSIQELLRRGLLQRLAEAQYRPPYVRRTEEEVKSLIRWILERSEGHWVEMEDLEPAVALCTNSKMGYQELLGCRDRTKTKKARELVQAALADLTKGRSRLERTSDKKKVCLRKNE